MSEVRWPTVTETAKRLGVSGAYIRKLIIAGRLTGHLRGNTWLLDPQSLNQYEATRTRRPGRKKRIAVPT